MSHIPNNAMPHAGQSSDGQAQNSDQSQMATGSGSAFGQLADKAREYPKTAIAAGAAVAAGVAAAAVLSRGRSEKGGRSGKRKKD